MRQSDIAAVEAAGLQFKYTEQLFEMRRLTLGRLAAMDARVGADPFYDGLQQLTLQRKGLSATDVTEMMQAVTEARSTRRSALERNCALIDIELDLRNRDLVKREPIGTTYYIDADNGDDANTGTTIGSAWATLDKYASVSRAPGDIAILRRDMTNQYDDGTSLTFSSDGTLESPIIIEADYDDVWGDFITSTGVFTVTVGTLTFEATLTVTDIAAGDWVYVSGDNPRKYNYEVATVSGTTVTLYLPYKGGQAGGAKTLINIGTAPTWGTKIFTSNAGFIDDFNWLVQGLHFVSTSTSGIISFGNCIVTFLDCVVEGNGNLDTMFSFSGSGRANVSLSRVRCFDYDNAVEWFNSAAIFDLFVNDSLFDGNNIPGSRGHNQLYSSGEVVYRNTTFKNHGQADIEFQAQDDHGGFVILDNCDLQSTSKIIGQTQAVAARQMQKGVKLTEYNGIDRDTRQYTHLSNDDTTELLASEFTNVRAGGNHHSVRIKPSTHLSPTEDYRWSQLVVWENAIYADTNSKVWEFYFHPVDLAEWTASPTANELYIEVEEYGHATNNVRKVVRSTDTIDTIGDLSWQKIAIAVTPLKVGKAIIRVIYRKKKESGKDDYLDFDPKPDVT